MTTGSSQFLAQSDRFKQASSAFAHLRIGQPPELAHWDHHILLRGEVFHQEMELENEPDKLAAFMCQLIIAQKALDRFATEANFRIHTLDPRRVTTGGSSAARRAGT